MAAKKTTGTEVIDWQKEMEAQAAIAAGNQRSTGGGGKFISTRAGVLSFDGDNMPGNQMAVVILADTLMNTYYEGVFDPDNPASPKCFAFGTDENEMEPHTAVDNDAYFERQNAQCAGCPQNEWGSAPTGRGKACKNVQRIALIPAGAYTAKGGRNGGYDLEVFDEPEHFKDAEVVYMNLPVMSVKNYATFVRTLAGEMRRPPHGVIANIFLQPDPKSQYKVCFEVIQELDGSLLSVIMPRHKVLKEEVAFPYSPPQEKEEAVPQKANNKLAKKPAAKARR